MVGSVRAAYTYYTRLRGTRGAARRGPARQSRAEKKLFRPQSFHRKCIQRTRPPPVNNYRFITLVN